MTSVPSATAMRGWGILRDRFVMAGILITAAVSLPLVSPALLSVFSTDNYNFYFDMPLLALTSLSLWSARGKATHQRARNFWGYLSVGFLFWLGVRLSDPLLDPDSRGAMVATDLMYLAFYLCVILGLQLRPHHAMQKTSDDSIQQLEFTGATLFVFGALVYFAIIPATYYPSSMSTDIPSTMLYVVLNIYLFLRVLTLRNDSHEAPWRPCYTLLVAATAGFVVLDALDLAARMDDGINAALSVTLFEALWLLPLLGFIAAARLYEPNDRAQHPATNTTEDPERLIWAWRGKLIYLALTPPLIHMTLEILGWSDEMTRFPREILVVSWLLAAAALSFVYDRRLFQQQESLAASHRLANQQLELAHRMDAVRRMAGGLAHDFNNLLMVIQGFADVLADRLTNEGDRSDAEQISKAAQRAGDLTRQLLALGSKGEREVQPFLPNDVLVKMRPTLERLMRADMTLSMELEETGYVMGDSGGFEDAILNLVLNAREASTRGGPISIRTSQQQSDAEDRLPAGTPGASRYGRIVVQDWGKGMDEETSRHVFEPFFSKRDGGTGLGLSMVYSFAREAGGTVDVTSEPGSGSQFCILLPEGQPPPEVEPLVSEPRGRQASDRTILLVEDEQSVRIVLARSLEAAGMRVVQASDGASALRLLEKSDGQIDLIVTDVVMPMMNGGTLARHIRDITESLPIIFMTGYAAGQLDRLGPNIAKIPVLKKPFEVKDLLQEIDRSLRHVH